MNNHRAGDGFISSAFILILDQLVFLIYL